MSIKTYNDDNLKIDVDAKADLIYADYIYENLDFSWVDKWWPNLKENGIFIIQTDWHSAAEVKVHTQSMPDAFFVNWLVWKNEFGNFPKNKFRQAHDDIIIFSKGRDYKFYPDRVQVKKATAKSKGLNKSGRLTKLATSVITDICLTTIAKERVKKDDGHCIRWQKPLKLIDRLFSPWVDEGDLVIDLFMGSGTSLEWCLRNNINGIGIEYDSDVYNIANNRLAKVIMEVNN